MPRLKNSFPTYRLHKPSGQALVCLDGRRIYLGKYDTPESRQAYDRAIAQWTSGGRVRSAAASAGPDVTVEEVIAAFWEHAQQHYRQPDGSPGEELNNFRWCLRHLRRLYGATPAKDFGPKALKAVRAAMLKPCEVVDEKTGARKTLAGGCRTYVNRQTSRIRHVFKWAVGEELVPASVHHGLMAVSGLKKGHADARESEGVGPVPEAYVEAALPFLSPQLAAVARLQLATGMRPGEACPMRGCDLDTTERVWACCSHTNHSGSTRPKPAISAARAGSIASGSFRRTRSTSTGRGWSAASTSVGG